MACERGDDGGSFVVWITGEHTKTFRERGDRLICRTPREEVVESALGRDRRVHGGTVGTVADDINV